MAVTIVDVAKRAGVSPSTVSRVISGHPRISPATVNKVKEIMADMGYHPNVMAKSLVSKTTSTIGIVLPRPAEELFQNMFFPEVIRGIVTHSSRTSYDLLMATGVTEREELEAVIRLVKGRRVDGLLLLHSRKRDPLVNFLREEHFPFVLVGRSEEHADILSVDNDNVQASYDATRHLISQGHRRIGFVSGPPNLVVSMDRLAGYRQALAEAGLASSPEWIVEGEFLQESGYQAMSFFMSLPERPTAIVVIDDLVGFGVLRGLTELGFKVPQDLGIIGFNNTPMAELATPPLSSVDIGIYQIGYTASQMLIRRIKGEKTMQPRAVIPHRLVVRESSLPPV
ncbi:LacI family transcriptional regulator [Gordoniibacillus kamchatkensis]|uniref:LacI family transcriptional regulator n=1 Tax=Gordoniibacillus kamchatkensis TaxID=1590651 RepID=A0ABR5ANV5_9BACL|nr:LacI family DNA-binding transcriptional regulator [Paenibacillus sp. VKM B-2647]KIL42220.1 LacI family transcriptional regulator [Paenibacillus sp. VKM B-2647]